METLLAVLSALGTLLLRLLSRPAIRMVRRRFGLIPLNAQLKINVHYMSELGAFAIVQSSDLPSPLTDAGIQRATEIGQCSFFDDTVFVLDLRNTSEGSTATPVSLTEITLLFRSAKCLADATLGTTLVQAQTIQAGGRGTEGDFVVRIASLPPNEVPLISGAIAENCPVARELRIDASSRAEIGIQVLPTEPGSFEFDVVATFRVWGRDFRKIVARNVSVVSWDSLNWPDRVVNTFNWTNPKDSELNDEAIQRLNELRGYAEQSCSPPPKGRVVRVCGGMEGSAWG